MIKEVVPRWRDGLGLALCKGATGREGSGRLRTSLCFDAQPPMLALCMLERAEDKGRPILNYDEGVGFSRKFQVSSGTEKGTNPLSGGTSLMCTKKLHKFLHSWKAYSRRIHGELRRHVPTLWELLV